MKILGIDTTAKTATVALCNDCELIAEFSTTTSSHSTVILPMIENIFKYCGVTVDDIDLYAVSAGPGSFTGVRIGVSTVKGLAFKNETPCIGVSSLEALAMSFCGIDGIVVPVIDARRDTVYTALFRTQCNGSFSRLTKDEQLTIDELFAMLSQYNETVYFTGDACDKITSRDDCPSCALAPERLKRQSAYGVCRAAYELWISSDDRSKFTDNNLVPIYLKKAQAERELEEKLQNNGEK